MAATETKSPPTLDQLKAKAPEAAAFLRHLANPGRLILLCHIAQGERSVTDIQHDLGFKQPALSQQLADLRRSGLVQTRRESRTIYYAIKDGRAAAVMAMLQQIFCGAAERPAQPAAEPPAPGATGDVAQFARLAADS